MKGNKQLVGVQGEFVISLRLGFRLTEEEALNLAAWIVAIVGDKGRWETAQDEVE